MSLTPFFRIMVDPSFEEQTHTECEMRGDYYFASLHFVPLQTTGAKTFGLPEYISGLALMVLAWTIADAKYHFRLDVAPFNARLITYAVVVAVGAATLLTDVWRAQGWCVIEAAGSPFTPVTWQAILAAVFIGAFICWAAIAFFIPAKFHRGNAVRYVSAMAKATLRGNSLDLAVIADELAAAAYGLVKHATNRDFRRVPLESQPYEPSEVERCANSILSMIGDRRLCRAMVASSPRTALFLFQEIKEQKRFDIEVGTFASNFVGAAIANKDSFIYHETTPWYWSGFLGMTQPVVKAMFADYELVSGVDKLFYVDHQEMGKWDTEHWSVYFKAMQITVADFIAKGNYRERTTINRAIGKLGDVTRYAYRINGIDSQEALSDT
ncbi:hypothetical protein [Rhodanobacter terrae]|uniref:Uncharacterized protein n=1 Tax=Rhodanobacter terrae TaxID=418647 RepID=A0ABW0ST35_9GAMM